MTKTYKPNQSAREIENRNPECPMMIMTSTAIQIFGQDPRETHVALANAHYGEHVQIVSTDGATFLASVADCNERGVILELE